MPPSLRSKSKKKQAGDSASKAVIKKSKKGKSKTPGDVQRENEEGVAVASTPKKKGAATIAPSTPAGVKTPPAGMKSPAVLIKEHQLPLPPTRTSETPSPYQVISDCIDATCYEILLVKNLSFDVYAVLAQRLEYYMELMDHDQAIEDDDVELVLKEVHVRNRLNIARLVTAMCSRPAYEEADCPVPPLISLSQEDWKAFRDEMNSSYEIMREIFANEKKTQSNRLIERQNLYVSIVWRIEAMEALTHLKSELTSFLKDFEEDGDDENKKSFSRPKDCITEYIQFMDRRRSELQSIHLTQYDDFFIPNKAIPQINLDNTDGAKESLTSFVNKLSAMVTKHAFPLKQIQIDLVRLGQECNKALPEPAVFKVGYFGGLKLPAEETSEQTQEETEEVEKSSAIIVSSPVKEASRSPRKKTRIFDDSSEDEKSSVKVTKKTVTSPALAKARNKRKRERLIATKENVSPTPVPRSSRKKPKKEKKLSPVQNIARSELSFDSDSDMKTSVSSVKRKRRVPYSDLEKETLMEGVERFGVGSWAEIRSYYDDVFKQNGRTNVNLKDLYRTLTK